MDQKVWCTGMTCAEILRVRSSETLFLVCSEARVNLLKNSMKLITTVIRYPQAWISRRSKQKLSVKNLVGDRILLQLLRQMLPSSRKAVSKRGLNYLTMAFAILPFYLAMGEMMEHLFLLFHGMNGMMNLALTNSCFTFCYSVYLSPLFVGGFGSLLMALYGLSVALGSAASLPTVLSVCTRWQTLFARETLLQLTARQCTAYPVAGWFLLWLPWVVLWE